MPKGSDVGVVVGRFQVHQLHAAHIQLIQSVYDSHRNTIIVLGLSQARVTDLNPLDFESRKQMLLDTFPKATLLYIKDNRSDVVWSDNLDRLINDVVTPAQTVKLYGGRDSFIARYKGNFETEVMEPELYLSSTELRKTISRGVRNTEDFRAGVIWATANGYPRPFPTVDVAIYRLVTASAMKHTCTKDDGGTPNRRCHACAAEGLEWLMVRKPGEPKWRFCGGFVQSGETYETAARREVSEETGAAVDGLLYLDSFVIDDWRYRSETEKITSAFFTAEYISGPVRPADDVSEAQWFALDKVAVIEEHQPLLARLQRRMSAGVLL